MGTARWPCATARGSVLPELFSGFLCHTPRLGASPYPESGLWALDTGFRVPFPLIARPSLCHELGSVQRVVGSLVVAVDFGLVRFKNLPEFTLAAHFVPVFGVVAALILLAGLLVEGVVGARGVGFVVLHPQTLPVSGKTHNPIIFFSEVDIYSCARVQKVDPHP